VLCHWWQPSNCDLRACFVDLQVADFGLTKLTEVGVASGPTRLVGTFGYMPPE